MLRVYQFRHFGLPLYYNKLRGKSTFCLSGKARALAIGKKMLTIILFY